MNLLAPAAVKEPGFFRFLLTLYERQRLIVVYLVEHLPQIGNDEHVWIIRGNGVAAFLRQINDMTFFVHAEIEVFIHLVEPLVPHIV